MNINDSLVAELRAINTRQAANMLNLMEVNRSQAEIFQKQLAERDKLIADLKKAYFKMKAVSDKLTEEINSLKHGKEKNSQNSSMPPSTDLEKAPKKQPTRKKKKGKANKGNRGKNLKQVDKPDFVVALKTPDTCQKCNESLADGKVLKTEKRQVFDIPRPELKVTEYQADTIKCVCCGQKNKAEFPKDVQSYTQYGPNLRNTATYLNNFQLIPQNRVEEALGHLCGTKISDTTLMKYNTKLAAAVEPKQQAVLQELKAATVRHVDETGFRIKKQNCYLHVLSDIKFTYYSCDWSRRTPFKDLTGGILVHDGYSTYSEIKVDHAVCNAHILRDLTAVSQLANGDFAKDMQTLLEDMLDGTYASANEKKSEKECLEMEEKYDAILKAAMLPYQARPPSTGTLARTVYNLIARMQKCKTDILRFFRVEGCPFTNNQAERDIRMMKLRQKISGCFRTEKGARIFCTIRGFISTCLKQGRDLFGEMMMA